MYMSGVLIVRHSGSPMYLMSSSPTFVDFFTLIYCAVWCFILFRAGVISFHLSSRREFELRIFQNFFPRKNKYLQVKPVETFLKERYVVVFIVIKK